MWWSDDLNRWAERLCLTLVGALGLLGLHYANIRFLPIAVGFAVIGGVCRFGRGFDRGRSRAARSLTDSARRRAL